MVYLDCFHIAIRYATVGHQCYTLSRFTYASHLFPRFSPILCHHQQHYQGILLLCATLWSDVKFLSAVTCPSSKCGHTSHLVEPNNASIYFQMSTQPVPLAAKVRGSSCPQSLTWQLPNIFYHLRKHVFSLCGFCFNGFNSLILGASCLHSCELSAFSAYIFFL